MADLIFLSLSRRGRNIEKRFPCSSRGLVSEKGEMDFQKAVIIFYSYLREDKYRKNCANWLESKGEIKEALVNAAKAKTFDEFYRNFCRISELQEKTAGKEEDAKLQNDMQRLLCGMFDSHASKRSAKILREISGEQDERRIEMMTQDYKETLDALNDIVLEKDFTQKYALFRFAFGDPI